MEACLQTVKAPFLFDCGEKIPTDVQFKSRVTKEEKNQLLYGREQLKLGTKLLFGLMVDSFMGLKITMFPTITMTKFCDVQIFLQ